MSFPRYPSYKDSGVEWLGEVPEGWEVRRLKNNVTLQTEKSDKRVFPVALENIEGWSGRFIETDTEFQGEGVAFQTGDILFGKLRPYLAKVLLAHQSGEAVGDFHVLRPGTRVQGRFLVYQILNREFIAIVDGSTFGAKMPRVGWEFMANMPCATPPISEQQTIAAFLDSETAKIDALVAEQENLIALLKEKRQAVISHAVTKGLDPTVPMKDSGVEWLGEVPAHWAVVPIKRICEIKDGTHDTPQYVDQSEISVPLITSKDFFGDSISFEDAKFISFEDHLAIIKRSNAEIGDVLMSMIGGNIGKAVIVKDGREFSIKNVALFKTRRNCELASYIMGYLQSGLLDIQISLLSRGGAQGFLSLGDIRNLIFLKISQSDMKAIAEHLSVYLARVDRLVAEVNRQIELLQERRSALISAAVTGKIDVRGYHAQPQPIV